MKINTRRLLRNALLVAVHLTLFVVVYCCAILIRFDLKFPEEQWQIFRSVLPWLFALKMVSFYYVRSFHGWWRYVTFADMADLLKAATVSTALVAAYDHFVFTGSQIPRGVLALDWALTVLMFGGLRSSGRLIREHFVPAVRPGNQRRALIVGASRSGETLVRMLRNEPRWGYRAVGFLDENLSNAGRRLSGLPVVGRPIAAVRLAARLRVEDILVAAESLPGDTMRVLIDQCRAGGLRLRVMPTAEELMRGVFRRLGRPVAISDLLKREPITLDNAMIESLLAGKRVLVTGAGGSIGSEICRQVMQFRPATLALLERYENNLFVIDRELQIAGESRLVRPYIADILDVDRMRAVFEEFRPDVVFHAAAHKHVPMMEANPGEAIKNNLLGTKVVADLAMEFSVKHFVMISTDKAVNPTSVMGVTKQLAERCVHAMNNVDVTSFIVVRFGNVLGSAGSVVPIFQQQIQSGGPVTVTHPEMRRYFMTIPEASQLVLQSAAMGHAGEILVLDMGEPIKILDLVHDMIYLSGMRPDDIEIRFTGLRPGEKLFEELRMDDERIMPTAHPKVNVAYQRGYEIAEVERMIAEFRDAVATSDELVRLMCKYVPEYRPETKSNAFAGGEYLTIARTGLSDDGPVPNSQRVEV